MDLNFEITKDIIGVIEICTAFIVAVLGIAYPILLQVIQYFDEKYGSTRIIYLFKKELEYRFFKISLFVSLFMTFFWMLTKYFLGGSFLYSLNLERFVIWILLINTTLLVTIFVMLIEKVFIYQNIKDLSKHLISRNEKI